MSSPETTQQMRVAVIGAGAAGMSAAYALSLHPDRFSVTVFEQSSVAGGMATSIPLDRSKYGADYINDGVQGGSPVFYNTYAMFDKLGFKASPVGMQVSFGRERDTDFWSNVFPSHVIDRFRSDIQKFGRVLKVIKALEPLFAVISVDAMLRIFMFSRDFGEIVVYPLVALFFGTGNQTPFISSAILERVFMDPNMRLFEYSPDSFLASIPEMRAFPRLSLLYQTWADEVQSRGNVILRTRQQVTRVIRDDHIQLWSRPTSGTNEGQHAQGSLELEAYEEFDELIIAVDADSALKLLGANASWLEKRILGNVKYLWDISVTHSDLGYMDKYYRLRYEPSLNSSHTDEDAKKAYKLAQEKFAPLYFIRSYPDDKKRVEMSFDLTNYQPQFKDEDPCGPQTPSSAVLPGPSPSLSSHVFQTIFLDRDGSSEKWSKGDIHPEHIIYEKWWKQQSHRWQHYAWTVPWMMLINGKHHTLYAGAWSILNMHEIAVVSGLAAAYRLGADYPFIRDGQCKRLFQLCLAVSHGSRMRAEDRHGIFA